jgi:entericidin B
MIRFIVAVSAVLTLGLLAACETVEGAGQDIESAGQAISNEAREADGE